MMIRQPILVALLLVALCVADEEDTVVKKPDVHKFKVPSPPPGEQFFYETFTDHDQFETRWIQSKATKDGADSDIAKYDGNWVLEEPTHTGALDGETGLVMKTEAKHYAIAAKLNKPFVFSDNEAFVVQYEINFQEALNCGGAYVKLLSVSDDLEEFNDKTPYSIMFGPDKCGHSSKIHFIVRFKHPVTGVIEEKHCKQPEKELDFFNDRRTHLFSLFIRADGRYSIVVDTLSIQTGTLLEDFTPSFIPPKEVDDPEDKKPEDWDDREEIPEPGATKPDDWDEDAPLKIPDPNAEKPAGWLDDAPEMVPDPEAEKPKDWDDDEDGDWEAPMIPNPVCEEIGCGEWKAPLIKNPAYKGKWRPPMIKNPKYSGVWAPKKIPNPDYFEETDLFPMFTPISAIGLELWTMSKDIIFDNFIITNEMTAANAFSMEGWTKKYESEQEALGASQQLGPWVNYFIDIANTYPYLWALYAIALVLPFVLCAACCVRTKSSQPKEDEAAKRKKTDAPTPDDARPAKEEEKEEKSSSKQQEEKSFIAPADEEEVSDAKKEESAKEESAKEESAKEEEEEEEEEHKDGPDSGVEGEAGEEEEGGGGEEEGKGEEEEEEEGEGQKEEQRPRRRGRKKTRRED